MPIARWYIEPSKLPSRPAEDLNHASNERFKLLLQCLSKLSLSSEQIFGELLEVSNEIIQRYVKLTDRIQNISRHITTFNVLEEPEVTVNEALLIRPFKSHLQKSSLQIRPHSLDQIYSQEALPMPQLYRLNQVNQPDGLLIELKFSNPNYFFEKWYGQVQQEVEKKPARKKKIEKKVVAVPKRMENMQLKMMKQKAMNELGIPQSPGTSKSQTVEKTNMISNQPINMPDEDDESYMNMNELPNPPPFLLQNNAPSTNQLHLTSTSPASLSPAQLLASLPSPAPLSPNQLLSPAPLGPDEMGTPPPLSPPRRSVYKVASFDRSSLVPPPPPPNMLPPPPPGMSLPHVEQTSGCFLKRDPSQRRKLAESKRESRMDLLSSIRSGIMLRKVTEEPAKSKASKTGLDVAAVMEMRRRAMQEDEDDDDDDEFEDCN